MSPYILILYSLNYTYEQNVVCVWLCMVENILKVPELQLVS